MTKQEILTALVMAVAVRDIESMARGTGAAIVVIVEGSRMAVVRTPRGVAVDSLTYGTHHFCMNELWEEFARLLNKPSWDDAPEEATHLVTGPDGQHWFCNREPERSVRWEMGLSGLEFINRCWPAGCSRVFPAGYDWKESLEERPV